MISAGEFVRWGKVATSSAWSTRRWSCVFIAASTWSTVWRPKVTTMISAGEFVRWGKVRAVVSA